MENKDKNELELLREKYEEKRVQYSLPDFKFMTEDFEIEKVAEKETNFLLREIRRVIIEKFSSYMHLFETILNPSSGSILIFSILKNLNEEDKKEIRAIYKKFAKIQIESMKLDTVYNEKEEALFVIESSKDWLLIREKIFKLFDKFNRELDLGTNGSPNCYFG